MKKNIPFSSISLIALVLSFYTLSTFAQTGPGGVGNSTENILWLDASKLSLSNNDAVSTWNEVSGNNNHAIQSNVSFKPTFKTNQINGFPAVDFDGTNDALNFTQNMTSENITSFLVFSNSTSGFSTLFHTDSNIYIIKTNNAGMGSFNSWNTNYVANANNAFHVFSGTSSSTSGIQTLTSGNDIYSKPFNDQKKFNTSILGAYYNVNNSTYSQHTKMLLAELIVYKEALNSAKRKIVSNYLAAKYNLIGEGNLYTYKTTFNHDVFGIGQETDGSQTVADNNGLLTFSNASDLDNGEYLLVGHDNAGTGNSASVPSGINQRLDQVWRVDQTGDVGTVDLTFSVASNNFATNGSDYVLLIENTDGDFSNGGVSIIETGRVYNGGNQTVSFSGITLADGIYFTLAEKKPLANLPSIDFGPGGVGNTTNIASWLDASRLSLSNNDAVFSMTDYSGNNNHAIQNTFSFKPTFKTGQINGLPAIDFDGNDDALNFVQNMTSKNITSFFVFSNSRIKLSTVLHTDSNIFLTYNNTAGMGSYNSWKFNSVPNVNKAFHVFSGTSSSATGFQTVTSDNNINSKTFNDYKDFNTSILGAYYNVNNSSYSQHTKMLLAEVIVYNEALNSAKRKIVSNYLATKYNLTAEQNLYAYSATNGTEVFGIGQESDGNHTESRGNDSLLINNASNLGNGDYILIGNNNADFNVSSSVSSAYIERWNRVWRADLTGTPGTIDMEFFIGANGFASITDYVIIIDSDGDFTSGATHHSIGRTYSVTNNSISFTGVNLSDGAYFTLAELSPNPTAIADGNWENTSTWSCDCIPTASLDVVIPATFDVTINDLANAKSVSIASGASLTFAGNDTLQIVEGLTINGTLNTGTGTLLGNGTSSQTFANSSGVNVSLNNLVAANASTLFLTGGWSLSNNLQVSSGTLNITGADSLVLLSSANKTAQILESAGSFVGDFTLQRFISSRNANFANISAPISNATVASIDDDLKLSGVGGNNGNAVNSTRTGTFYSMYSYDRTNNNKLDTITSTATTLDPGLGYEVYLFNTLVTMNDTIIDYVGTPNSGNVNPPNILTGFNLVGNPYQSFIAFDNLDQSNIQNTFYVYETNNGSYGTYGAGDVIAPGQGFWVDNQTGGSVPFNFEESDKIVSNSSVFLRKKTAKPFILELSNDVNYFKNRLQIGFDYSATEGIDQFDAVYLPSPHTGASELYSKTLDSDKLIKNTLNQFEQSHHIPLELKIGESGTYQIESKNLNNLLENYSCVYLDDQKTNDRIDLSMINTYSFEAESGISNRFNLILSNSFDECEKKMEDESVNQKIDSRLNLRESYGSWYLDYKLGNQNQTFRISVYSLNGQLVLPSKEISLSENGTVELSELKNLDGIFVIQIIGQEDLINKTIKL